MSFFSKKRRLEKLLSRVKALSEKRADEVSDIDVVKLGKELETYMRLEYPSRVEALINSDNVSLGTVYSMNKKLGEIYTWIDFCRRFETEQEIYEKVLQKHLSELNDLFQ